MLTIDWGKIDIENFYNFGSKLSMNTFHASPIGLSEEIAGKEFDENRLIKGDYRHIELPVIFKQSTGKNFHDMLDTGWPSLYLISDKMENVLEQNNLTGWKTFPVQVIDKKGSEVKGYQGLSITGRCGPVDYTKCEIIEKRAFPDAPLVKYYKGLYVGLDKWDGSDFFSS